jgi:hypothetical protein
MRTLSAYCCCSGSACVNKHRVSPFPRCSREATAPDTHTDPSRAGEMREDCRCCMDPSQHQSGQPLRPPSARSKSRIRALDQCLSLPELRRSAAAGRAAGAAPARACRRHHASDWRPFWRPAGCVLGHAGSARGWLGAGCGWCGGGCRWLGDLGLQGAMSLLHLTYCGKRAKIIVAAGKCEGR